MTGPSFTLPPDLQAKFMSLLREVDGQYEVVDMTALVLFVAENCEAHPQLLDLVNIKEEAIVEHFERTGEVLPGTKLVKTTTHEDSNVVGLEVLRGPIPPKV
jgi:hypothetical protein